MLVRKMRLTPPVLVCDFVSDILFFKYSFQHVSLMFKLCVTPAWFFFSPIPHQKGNLMPVCWRAFIFCLLQRLIETKNRSGFLSRSRTPAAVIDQWGGGGGVRVAALMELPASLQRSDGDATFSRGSLLISFPFAFSVLCPKAFSHGGSRTRLMVGQGTWLTGFFGGNYKEIFVFSTFQHI